MAGSSACRDPIAQLNRNFHRGRGHTLRLLSVDQIGYRGVCCGKDLVLRYDAVTCSTCGRSQPHWSDVAIVQTTLHNCRDGTVLALIGENCHYRFGHRQSPRVEFDGVAERWFGPCC